MCCNSGSPGVLRLYVIDTMYLVLLLMLWTGSDEEMDKLAEEEEEEALALQKHMAASLDEQDFDAAEFEVCLYSLPCERVSV